MSVQMELFGAEWCQRWRGRAEMWQPDTGERFTGRGYTVEPIADDTTPRAFVLAHHYSGSYVASRLRFGLYAPGGELVGVAVYSNPATLAVLTCVFPELNPRCESVELGRFVLLDQVPGNAESWFLARCHEQLLDDGVAGIVSFSDPVPRRAPCGQLITPGHVGTIYQATNGVYTGKTDKRYLWVLPDGTIFNGQALQKIRQQKQGHAYAERQLMRWGARPMRPGEDPKAWLREARTACRVSIFPHPGVHRYVFPLGATKQARDAVRLGLPSLPYPKTRETRELVAAR